jgi:hypothetical protein
MCGIKIQRELSGRLRTVFLWEIGQAKIRRTEVRPMFRRRATSDFPTLTRFESCMDLSPRQLTQDLGESFRSVRDALL